MTFEQRKGNFQHESGSISELLLLKEFSSLYVYVIGWLAVLF